MEVKILTTKEILELKPGDTITKTEMKTLITESKKKSSAYYLGEEFVINDTFQKGINWIGDINNQKLLL